MWDLMLKKRKYVTFLAACRTPRPAEKQNTAMQSKGLAKLWAPVPSGTMPRLVSDAEAPLRVRAFTASAALRLRQMSCWPCVLHLRWGCLLPGVHSYSPQRLGLARC